MKKSVLHLFLYLASMALALILLIGIFNLGPDENVQNPTSITENNHFNIILEEFQRNLSAPITGLLIQILVILLFSRFCAVVLKKLGQPQVIGEMIAGILLGKSVLASFWPEAFLAIFPESSMPRLFYLSQIGLILFMFVVGLDLKISEIKNKASAAILISHVSIVLPFLLGAGLALAIYGEYAPQSFTFASFALFMGIAMSITAFPVLARIIQERKLTQTPLGVMAITCAAIDDVTAWCLLAAVVGIVKAGSASSALVVILVSLVYVVIMFKVVKPFLARILFKKDNGNWDRVSLAIIFCMLLTSSLIAEVIGIHALFGAFLAGTIIPEISSLRSVLIEKIEDLSAVVLLPIFFAYTGMRTQIGLLDSWKDWLICLAIIILAVFGKMVGSAFAARWSGMKWRESWALGALMNTRGLMELVVLNIGYDIGILTPQVFAMMVIMAIATTVMTGPFLTLILKKTEYKK